jgi:hypothetical protein
MAAGEAWARTDGRAPFRAHWISRGGDFLAHEQATCEGPSCCRCSLFPIGDVLVAFGAQGLLRNATQPARSWCNPRAVEATCNGVFSLHERVLSYVAAWQVRVIIS